MLDARLLLGLASLDILAILRRTALRQREQRRSDAVIDGACQSLLEDKTARRNPSCLKWVQGQFVRSPGIFVFVLCVFVVRFRLFIVTLSDRLLNNCAFDGVLV